MNDDTKKGKETTEKRRNARLKVNKDVRVEVDGEVVVGDATDISLSGVAVNTLVDMSTEQFVKLHLEKIGELTGEIIRETEQGFAVEFEVVEDNGSVLEEKLRSMMGSKKTKEKKAKAKPKSDDPVAEERARMEAHLLTMLGGGDD